MCFETHHYLQNKFCLRKNYNLLLLDYLAFFLTSKLFFWTFQALLTLVSLLSKSILLTKSACFNLAVTFSAINLLNFWAVIYLAWSSIFFSKMCSSVFICASIDLCETKQLHQESFLVNDLLLSLVCWILCF